MDTTWRADVFKQTNKQTHVTLMVREAGTEKTTTRGWRVGDAYFIWFTVACRELGHGPHVPNEPVSLREGLENCTLVILGYWLFGKQGIKKKEMGVPAVAQQKWIWLVSMRMQIRSLASFSELRIRRCREPWSRSQTRKKKKNYFRKIISVWRNLVLHHWL